MNTKITECYVCIEPYTKKRKEVLCTCGYSVCVVCIDMYTHQIDQTLHCMSCKKEWSLEFIRTHLPRNFIDKTYKRHLEHLLLGREKNLLPSAQLVLEKRKEDEKLKQRIKHFKNEIFYHDITRIDLRQTLADLRKTHRIELKNVPKKEKPETRERHLEIEREYVGLLLDMVSKSNELMIDLDQLQEELKGTGEPKVQPRKFVRQCPVDNCRGFLSIRWKCGLCNSQACKECMEVRDDDHKCDDDTVATVQQLSKDSKPCPCCGVIIFKISGCDQMFCVECRTAWGWRSGKITTGRVHNPHYYEMRRKNKTLTREVGGLCGGVVGWSLLIGYIPSIYRGKIELYHQHIAHYEEAVIPTLFDGYYNPQLDIDLRVKYLKNELNEDNWKVLLQRRYKNRNKEELVRNVYQTYTATLSIIIDNLYADIKDVCKGCKKGGKNKICKTMLCGERDKMCNYYLIQCGVIKHECNDQLMIIANMFKVQPTLIFLGVPRSVFDLTDFEM